MAQPTVPAPAQFRLAEETSADRFFQLGRSGYYDPSRSLRVVAGKWVQFGIAGQPATAPAWRGRTIADDTLLHPNHAGTIAFANTGPGTRSTQGYINLGDNSAPNDHEPGFAPFGKVVWCMEVLLRPYAGYNEASGCGMRAGRQDRLFVEGNRNLDAALPRLSRLNRLTAEAF